MSHVGCLVIFCKGVLLSRLPRGDNDPSRGRGHGQTASPSFPHLLSPSKGLRLGKLFTKPRIRLPRRRRLAFLQLRRLWRLLHRRIPYFRTTTLLPATWLRHLWMTRWRMVNTQICIYPPNSNLTLFEGSVLQLLSQSNVYKQMLKFICIDEVDCVSWASFREKCEGCLGKLGTFFPKVQILVASANVAAWQYSLLVQSLKLRKVCIIALLSICY